MQGHHRELNAEDVERAHAILAGIAERARQVDPQAHLTRTAEMATVAVDMLRRELTSTT